MRPTLAASVRDALLVARFELLRALRTWRALALGVLFLVAIGGADWLFVEIIGLMERLLAETLGVPATDTPGAMLHRLADSEGFREMIGLMVGRERVDAALGWPVLAVFHLWVGLVLVPFLAASTAAECISVDLASRSLRFEAQRTGRLELVTGRFLGQVVLLGGASALGAVATWAIGMTRMVGNDPVELAAALLALGVRAWAFGVPFVGIGVACSQLTASPMWARVLAVGATTGTWALFGAARWAEARGTGLFAVDAALQILPQGWIGGLWEPAPGWIVSSGVCLALGLAAVGVGYLRFARRDL